MAAAVVGIAAPLDEAALLELVEEPDELAAVVAERVGDRPLRLAGALLEEREHRVLLRAGADGVERLVGPFLDGEAEPLQQIRRAGEQLSSSREGPGCVVAISREV